MKTGGQPYPERAENDWNTAYICQVWESDASLRRKFQVIERCECQRCQSFHVHRYAASSGNDRENTFLDRPLNTALNGTKTSWKEWDQTR